MQGSFLQIRQNVGMPVPVAKVAGGGQRRPRRKGPLCVVVTVQGEPLLLEVIDLRRPPRRLTGRLHRRQEQADQYSADGEHHQQLDKRKTV
jgi:hypothetical protein